MSLEDVELHFGNQYLLCCPHCKHVWAHHGAVTVYSRKEEDGPVTKTCVMPDGSVQQNLGAMQNPSGRRDGVVIQFYCEMNCPPVEITLEQHKGMSTLTTRELTDAPSGTLMLSTRMLKVKPC